MNSEIISIIKRHDIDNRIKAGEICKQLKQIGIEIGTPQLRHTINDLRTNGHEIGSDSNGYFWAKNGEELTHTKAQMLSRISKISQAVRGLDKCFNEAELTFFG